MYMFTSTVLYVEGKCYKETCSTYIKIRQVKPETEMDWGVVAPSSGEYGELHALELLLHDEICQMPTIHIVSVYISQ